MKNTKLLLIGAVVLLVLGGAFFYFQSSGNSPLNVTNDPMKSMENALTGSGSVRCEFTDEDGRNITTYVKNGQIRSDFTGGEEGQGGMIFKNDTIWTWDQTTMQGFTMVVPKTDGTEDDAVDNGQSPVNQKKEIEDQIEKYKESCNNENVSDSVFEPPSDITFQNMNDFMNSLPQMPQGN
ncbi:MAG TPA: hypothetical protein PLD54_01525 [Candidatus Levybacteria bacterium]|nr:hypothetical protein [Candidatus Levybacteria bacterium]